MRKVTNINDIAKGVVVVEFIQQESRASRKLENILEKFESDFDDIDFVKVDVEESPDVASPFFVTDFPAAFALADGLILDRIDQVNTASEIERKLNQLDRLMVQATRKKQNCNRYFFK